MAAGKMKTVFFCQECGYESAKWMGQCPGCKAWNTMVEEPVRAKAAATGGGRAASGGTGQSAYRRVGAAAPVSLSSIEEREEERFSTGFSELDRVLGGGIVPGSLILVGGDPGIGKSTLLLQAARNMAEQGREIVYVSGEESIRQIKLRADRIGGVRDSLRFLCETDLESITEILERRKPALAIIDSIQTMNNESVQAAPGSVSQVRETTGILLRLAKETGIAFFIVGHVTKEGTVAGPRVLEHMVDTVLYFEGDRYASYRILRGVKNRFGSTNEIGVFEMRGEGLAEVLNPSEYMLSGRPQGASGSIVTCAMEGTRPMLIEVQALVCKSNFGFPKRQATGTDFNRVSLLMAVLEKRLGVPLSDFDAYVNLAGGMKQTEPAVDLGIALAVLSSYRNRPLPDSLIAFGEVGLSGEVRAVTMAQSRVGEAAKMGFTTCLLPASSLKGWKKPEGIELIGVSNLREAAEYLG
ncbi:MAG: DNA repair protein RadA [Eubacteriales bacterium]|nr:DNA repair protein RadA [Eubacteriales bacterium]